MRTATTATLVLGALQLVHAYDRIAGYSPASLVTQEAALDGDQERITHYTEKVVPADYAAVYDI